MKAKAQQFGFTLVEMLVVVAIIAVMVGVAALNAGDILRSQRSTSARNLIRSSLAQAQAYAQTNRKYAGLRFQFDRNGWDRGRQYMVLIEKVGVDHVFNPIPNSKPLALPKTIGVIPVEQASDTGLDDEYSNSDGMEGAATFSIIFSPSGQLVVKDVYLCQRFIGDPVVGNATDVNSGISLLYSDWWDDGVDWCVAEPSALGLIVCETTRLREARPDWRYADYVVNLEPILINVYTGTFIED